MAQAVPPGGPEMIIAPGMIIVLVFFLAMMVTFFYLSRNRSKRDNETRCRKCGYILKGISEPRCSECGERI